ncbi:lecithin retinol acyltransferase family protein [Nodosilinea sp. LEGE 06152]|uniref:lecithin retinol acyltransferase family protein n=1 Tax=Nodosilinea sp. LEGE 06152 TaxID=2777966 RepID=UPI00188288BD|nr:lecithin retinol acyltransferase family protein [Nodosilinea sp. LEGE 06152]MBE9156501.1 lecithin retinol acyltransferase family protein [Nodosilinea sp. LEGE 06152]
MAKGDQIYVMRDLAGVPGLYQHHGIDCGDGTVIHYSKARDIAEIARTSYEAFAWGNPVYTVRQSIIYTPDTVMERATSRLGERQYDLLQNNCEHFANWCTTGRSESRQLANFGLQTNQLNLPELRRLADRDRHVTTPEQARANFQKALGDIATAYNTTLADQQTAQKDVRDWHRVAQKALNNRREDLARAALHRKVAASKRAEMLTTQLSELVELELNLQRNRAFVQRQVGSGWVGE